MAVVEARNLSKVFKQGELGAVNNVHLETREGEFLVLLDLPVPARLRSCA